MTRQAKQDFPASLWDGLSYQYDSLLIDKNPEFFWKDKATQEIQALEQYLIDRGELFAFFDTLGPANSFIAVSPDSSSLIYKEFEAGPGIGIAHTDDSVIFSTVAGNLTQITNAENAPLLQGSPVYSFGNGTVKRARANSGGLVKVIGFVHEYIESNSIGNIQTNGIFQATQDTWDALTGETGGLVPNTSYYLSEITPGGLRSSPPTSGYVVPLGTALSTTQLKISTLHTILL
ncbi:MAG: hypothetical protein M0Q12_07990 [Synergistaceae bacterium]|jgi:hypothetical protein|nr:hypothetical protein [Synergistaceae bacterium]